MTAIGVCDVKTQLSNLLDRVGRGERFLITKHGRPVEQLVPAMVIATAQVKEAIKAMEE